MKKILTICFMIFLAVLIVSAGDVIFSGNVIFQGGTVETGDTQTTNLNITEDFRVNHCIKSYDTETTICFENNGVSIIG
jgi:hypothetical protein